MKIKFIALLAFIAIAFSSCELGDDDQPRVEFTLLPITDVEIPEPFKFGEFNEIIVRYNNPSDCYRFERFTVDFDLNMREVQVVSSYIDTGECTEGNIPTEQILRFRPTSNGTIIF